MAIFTTNESGNSGLSEAAMKVLHWWQKGQTKMKMIE